MSKSKEVRELVKELRQAGYVVVQGKSNHLKVYDDGRLITTLSLSPSDRMWSKRARQDIAKYGSKPLSN